MNKSIKVLSIVLVVTGALVITTGIISAKKEKQKKSDILRNYTIASIIYDTDNPSYRKLGDLQEDTEEIKCIGDKYYQVKYVDTHMYLLVNPYADNLSKDKKDDKWYWAMTKIK